MFTLTMILRNLTRHRLRTTLTILGLVIAVLAFGLLQTFVNAWYAGAEAASTTRLVTRNAISLVFSLPVSYESKIRGVEGVTGVGYANWFGGIYQDPKNFFPQFAISDANYLDLYPEYLIKDDEKLAFLRDRRGCIVGRKLAEQYGFKIGDVIPIKGTIYPGTWPFVVRAIYDGRDPATNTLTMFFHWSYLNESLLKTVPRRANQMGVYVLQIKDPDNAAAISNAVDQTFKNSLAETLTETEKAFQLGFVSMSEQIVLAIKVVSFVVIIIIMAVMANTMAMSARERLGEYATLKALGFGPRFLVTLIFGESMTLAMLGAGLGILVLFPLAKGIGKGLGNIFPVFEVNRDTVMMQIVAAVIVGLVAAIVPCVRSARVNIVEGLRSIG